MKDQEIIFGFENGMTAADKRWFEKAERITAKVPFCQDWVEYKGEVVFAELDINKSVDCGRPIIGIGYCATAVIVNRHIDSSHNYSPDTFKPCHLSSFTSPTKTKT